MTRGSRGFTIIEMLVSVAIMMTITGAIFQLMNPAQGVFKAQPEVSDMQQRMRIGTDALYKDLLMAGAGTYSGAAVGTLGNYFAAVLPFRRGTTTPDAVGTFATDRVSIIYVPSTPSQTKVVSMASVGANVVVSLEPGCPSSDPLCGFKKDMPVVIFDGTGVFDIFKISATPSSSPISLSHTGNLSKVYDSTAYVAQVVTATYWLKTDTTAKTYQLMKYDGFSTDLPIAENIVGLNFQYFGEPQQPVLRKPLTDAKGPWTSYGPKPPIVGVDDTATTTYGAGENCLFTVSSGTTITRPTMLDLGGPADSLVELTEAQLEDGPWCPDPAAAYRYDADLLRIRKIRVTLRVQVGSESLRGSSSLFTRAGTSQGGERFVPDQEIKFDVTPRNLNFGR